MSEITESESNKRTHAPQGSKTFNYNDKAGKGN